MLEGSLCAWGLYLGNLAYSNIVIKKTSLGCNAECIKFPVRSEELDPGCLSPFAHTNEMFMYITGSLRSKLLHKTLRRNRWNKYTKTSADNDFLFAIKHHTSIWYPEE